jgi:hypothetical protein
MSPDQIEGPFDTIESAHEFMTVLAATAVDAISELGRDRARALKEGDLRRAQAIDLALYKLKTLNCCVFKGRRALNDLRTLRRLILNERMTTRESVIAAM